MRNVPIFELQLPFRSFAPLGSALGMVCLLLLLMFAADTARCRDPGGRPGQDVEAGTGPIMADCKEVDFGEVLSGEVLTRKITVLNRGDAACTLTRVTFTCGCTLPWITLPSGQTISPEKLEGDGLCVLQPRESCVLELEFRAQMLSGRLARKIFIFVDLSPAPALTLPVLANVKPALTLEPRRIDFGRFSWKEPVSRQMIIRSAALGEFAIEEITGLPPYLDAKAERVVDAPVPTWRITLNLCRKPPAGNQNVILLLKIDSARIRSWKIQVSALIEPEVTFTAEPGGDAINFGVLREGERACASVEVVNRNPAVPYQIEEIILDSPDAAHLSTRLRTVEAGRRFKLFLDVSEEMRSRFFRGKIVLLSKHPEVPRKEIPFKGWINLSDPVEKRKENEEER